MASEKMKIRIAFLSAIITLVSFLYKLSLGIITTSMVLIIASFSTLMVFVCKILYAKFFTQSREKKKRAYFFMAVAAASFVGLFILFSVLKIGGVDTAKQNNFSGWVNILFIAFILLMFVLSIINLKGALQKDDIIVTGIKEMTFISALTDVAIILEFITRTVYKYVGRIPTGLLIANNYAPIAVSVFMIIVVVSMFKRHATYKA